MSDPTPTKCDYGRCSNGMHYNRYREVIEPCPDSTSDPTPTLIERLRAMLDSDHLAHEAASALEAKDAEIERMKEKIDDHDGRWASLADFINTELRMNNGDCFQLASWEGDFKKAVRDLVDCTRSATIYAHSKRD